MTKYLILAALLAACGKNNGSPPATAQAAPADSAPPAATTTATATATTGVAVGVNGDTLAPNKMGRIPILEYHVIGDHNAAYTRERSSFRQDLEKLYARGYRPVEVVDLINKTIDLPRGLSPVVFVFDDASPEQFSYIEHNGQLEIDPNSGLGIWQAFQKTHPDWKNKATFCVLSGAAAGHAFFGNNGIKGQKTEWRYKKLKYLADQGYEICNHTLWHAQLSKYPDAFVQQQIAQLALAVDSAVPGYKMHTMALPQGLWPKNRELAHKGSWTDPKSGKTISYDYQAVLEVAGGPARSPFDPQFNGLTLPRVQAVDPSMWAALDNLDKTHTRYVSDGK